MAVNIVVPTIAECFDITESHVHPNDDIDRDYSYPALWCLVMLDDPGGLVIDAVGERIEKDYPRWEPSVSLHQVRDVILDVSRHLAKASSGVSKNMQASDECGTGGGDSHLEFGGQGHADA